MGGAGFVTSVYLAYGRTLIDNCEDAWNEGGSGSITSSLDSSDYQVGAGSAKLLATGSISANTLLQSEVVSANVTAHTHVVCWSKVNNANLLTSGYFQLLLDESANCASPDESLNLGTHVINQWRSNVLTMNSPSSLDAVISVGCKVITDAMDSTMAIWLDEVFATTARSFSVLSVRGLDRPDDVVFWPPVQETLLDGTIYEDINAFRRRITIDLKAMTSTTDFNFIMTWLRNDYKYVISDNDIVRVVLEQPDSHAFEWLSGLDLTKGATITVLEKAVRTAHPASWGY